MKFFSLALLFVSQLSFGAIYNFEELVPGPFKVMEFPKLKVESEYNEIAFVGGDIGRPAHFGEQSIYSSGTLTLTFNPPISQIGISITPYKKGQGNLICWMIDTQTGLPYPYTISDTTAVGMVYGQFDNVGAAPWRRYKITKCTIKVLNEGMWIDSVGVTE